MLIEGQLRGVGAPVVESRLCYTGNRRYVAGMVSLLEDICRLCGTIDSGLNGSETTQASQQ